MRRLTRVLRDLQYERKGLDIGVYLQTGVPAARGTAAPLGTAFRMAELAESNGLSYLWLPDGTIRGSHYKYDALAMMSATAAITRRIKIGSIVLAAERNAIQLAHSLATIDRLSSGRITIAIGVGTDAPALRKEYSCLGVPFSRRGAMTDECIEIMRRLWTEDHVSYKGRFYSFDDVSLEPKPLHPPKILICGNSERSLKRAGSIGDGWLDAPMKRTVRDFSERCSKVREYAGKVGRDPSQLEFFAHIEAVIDRDRERAGLEAADFYLPYMSNIYAQLPKKLPPDMGLFGTPEELVRHLEEFKAHGANKAIIEFLSYDPLRQLGILLTEVLPSFK